MPDRSIRRAFWQGARDSLPFLIVVVPFGMIFGVLASEAGWTLAQTLGMSVLVIAGASQFTALQLLNEQAPLLIVIATSLAVNLRMAMYSASIAPYIGGAPRLAAGAGGLLPDRPDLRRGDRPLRPAAAARRRARTWPTSSAARCRSAGRGTRRPGPERSPGAAIPEALALDFAVPVTFIALVAPGLRTLPNLAAAVVSVAVALALSRLPYSLGLMVAAVAAMLTGAFVELRQARRDERGGADLDGDRRDRRRHLPDPLLVHRARRRPAAAGLGDAAAALRADGGDAGAGGAAGGLAAGHGRRDRPGAGARRARRARRSAPRRAACSAPSSAGWARSTSRCGPGL